MSNRPAPELELSHDLARSLLKDQAPAHVDKPLQVLSRGWDNTSYLLGDDLIVRLPHRAVAADLIRHEQRWLPTLAPHLELPIPVPVCSGHPGHDYPWHWSIVPFYPGEEAATATLRDPVATAIKFGEFLAQLNRSAPQDSPPNPYRGCPLADRADSFHERLRQLDDHYDHAAILAVFQDALATQPATHRSWLHGDLHTRNMVVHNGDLSAVIDWGDMCAGDRATDLAGAYMFVPDHIPPVQNYAGGSNADWARARGWAINFAVMYLTGSDDDPVMQAIGERLLATLLR